MAKKPVVTVAWGGGVNSTAMLIGLWERDARPDHILFADTGGEKPETYAFVKVFDDWLTRVGFPALIIVRNDGMYRDLEDNCLRKGMLPSRAFGFSSCADKYKIRPQHKWLRERGLIWRKGRVQEKSIWLIGYDYGEQRRAKIDSDEWFLYRYPLIEWKWMREECVEAIQRVGLPVPPKSACFYCPSSTKSEIRRLAVEHPDLFARAVEMERNAAPNLGTVKGLGRRFSWEALIAGDQEAATVPETVETACACFDGEDDDAD